MTMYVPDVADFGPVGLVELNERAALLDRMESKYLVRAPQFADVLVDLGRSFDVLSIDGRRTFTYETVYFDSSDLLAYRQHVQGKRRRFKIRTRRYVESNLYFFEVKLKGQRGRTVKERFGCSEHHHGQMSKPALDFVQKVFGSAYGEDFTVALSPQLAMQYRRLTLAAKGGGERVTVDYGLLFAGPAGTLVPAPDDVVIIEVKSADGKGAADVVVRSHGLRPGNCSKYCMGLNLVRPGLRNNPFKRTLVDYFSWPASPEAFPAICA